MKIKHIQMENWILGCLLFFIILNTIWRYNIPYFSRIFLLLSGEMLAFFVLGRWWLFWFFLSLVLCIAIFCIAQIVILTFLFHIIVYVQRKTIVMRTFCFSRPFIQSSHEVEVMVFSCANWRNVKVLNAIADKMIMKTNNAHERKNRNEFKSHFLWLFFIQKKRYMNIYIIWVCHVRNVLKMKLSFKTNRALNSYHRFNQSE